MNTVFINNREVSVSILRHAEFQTVVKALTLLGKKIDEIELDGSYYVDLDTVYYRRFPTDVINKMYRQIINGNCNVKLLYDNRRFYYISYDYKIILPETANEDNKLNLRVKISDI